MPTDTKTERLKCERVHSRLKHQLLSSRQHSGRLTVWIWIRLIIKSGRYFRSKCTRWRSPVLMSCVSISRLYGMNLTSVLLTRRSSDYVTLHRATLNRTTVKRRHFNGRQLTAATDNSATLNLATFNREHGGTKASAGRQRTYLRTSLLVSYSIFNPISFTLRMTLWHRRKFNSPSYSHLDTFHWKPS